MFVGPPTHGLSHENDAPAGNGLGVDSQCPGIPSAWSADDGIHSFELTIAVPPIPNHTVANRGAAGSANQRRMIGLCMRRGKSSPRPSS